MGVRIIDHSRVHPTRVKKIGGSFYIKLPQTWVHTKKVVENEVLLVIDNEDNTLTVVQLTEYRKQNSRGV